MNYGPILFLGILFTLASSWVGLVLMPHRQLASLAANVNTNTLVIYPQQRSGEAQQGAEEYRALGCVYCHSQQVRQDGFGADIQRGWGKRRSVARDYLFDKPVFLGTMRTGPDLTNIGERQPSDSWHLQHLYNPQVTSKGSIMPPYAFLFEKRRIHDAPSTNAVQLPPEFAPEKGWEIVPLPAAKELVAYLKSLRTSVSLPEAPLPEGAEPPPPAAGSTNALAAGATNSVPATNAPPATNAAPAAK